MRPIREQCRQAYRTLIKKDEKLVEVLREEALDLVTSKFKVTRETYGPNSVAFQVLCRISNEEAYFTIKLVRVGFKMNNIDNCARMCRARRLPDLPCHLARALRQIPFAEEDSEIIYWKTKIDKVTPHTN